MKRHNLQAMIIVVFFIVAMVHLADLDKVLAMLIIMSSILVNILIVISEINNKMK